MTEPIHRYRRFKGWDYAKGASLFITIGVEPRRRLFGEVDGGEVKLSWPGEKIVSLRVSREVAAPDAISAVVRRMENAVEKGYVVISGFISKGERAVRDMLCRRKDARFVRVLPSSLPNRRFKPESVYVAPFSQNRYLEIARGNDESEFGRRACLDLNEEIIEIATAGEGLALYWKSDGPKELASSEGNAKQ